MKRIIYLPDNLNNRKYALRGTYHGHGIYKELCPTGYFVSQSWAIVREEDSMTIRIQSFNNMCKDELLDCIDNYEALGEYGLVGKNVIYETTTKKYGFGFSVYPNGKEKI